MSKDKNGIKKTNPTLGYRRGNWEPYRVSGNVDLFFRGYTGYATLEQFYGRISQDDKIRVMQTDYRWRPYWMHKEPDEYSSCTRAVDREVDNES